MRRERRGCLLTAHSVIWQRFCSGGDSALFQQAHADLMKQFWYSESNGIGSAPRLMPARYQLLPIRTPPNSIPTPTPGTESQTSRAQLGAGYPKLAISLFSKNVKPMTYIPKLPTFSTFPSLCLNITFAERPGKYMASSSCSIQYPSSLLTAPSSVRPVLSIAINLSKRPCTCSNPEVFPQ